MAASRTDTTRLGRRQHRALRKPNRRSGTTRDSTRPAPLTSSPAVRQATAPRLVPLTTKTDCQVVTVKRQAAKLEVGNAAGGVCLHAGDFTTATLRSAAPPVYLDDPGLAGLSQRPEYISLPVRQQTLEWVRNLRWQTWGSDIARGRGTWERCTFGRCKRAATQVTLSQRLPRDCSTGSSYTRITFTTPAGRRTVVAARYVCEDD